MHNPFAKLPGGNPTSAPPFFRAHATRFAAVLLLLTIATSGCAGTSTQAAGNEKSAAKQGVWVAVQVVAGGFSAKLRGADVAGQDVRWGLLTAEGSAVQTGTATTDGSGAFIVKAKRELAVVFVVEHDLWSAWAELPRP